ncbi:MAG: TPM domain-containing protein [Bacteroidota bacterium]|nr:TPM domain-containing protein [Bacteroidota bacterium]
MKKQFFTKEENDRIVEAIQAAEKETSGEIRVFVESRCKYTEPLLRARQIFGKLKMGETTHHNGVLFYMAVDDRQLAIFGDHGIHEVVGEKYWKELVAHVLIYFNKENYADGICQCVLKLGESLRTYFPYDAQTAKNEIPDEIVFGK